MLCANPPDKQTARKHVSPAVLGQICPRGNCKRGGLHLQLQADTKSSGVCRQTCRQAHRRTSNMP